MKNMAILFIAFILIFQAGFISAQETDVGVSAIISPPETIVMDVAYPLKSEVTNFGINTVTFDVVFDVLIEGTSTLLLSDTSTVIFMPGGAVDTITFSQAFTPTLDETFQLISYTVLASDENPANNTSAITTTFEVEVGLWYGVLDGSPLECNINSDLNVPTYIYCAEDVYIGSVHFCLGANDLYIESLLSETEGIRYYPFTEWDAGLFIAPDGSPPNPEGWSSQSFVGFARTSPIPPYPPWLHFTTPTLVLDYAVHTADDPTLIGQTVNAIGAGLNQYQGPSNASDSTGFNTFELVELFSPLYFLGAGHVAGTVTNELSEPVEGVIVSDMNSSKIDITDEFGNYTLADLFPGSHDISFSHPNHLDTVVTDVNVIANHTTTLDVQLEPLPFDDVGVSKIISPPQFVQLGIEYSLESEVVNYGTATSTFDVIFEAYLLGNPIPFLNETVTVTDMAGSSTDTVTFENTLFTEYDTTYQLVSYTVLEEDANASNDTSTSSSSIFFGVSAWYGNLDETPLDGNIDDRLEVDVYIQTVENIYLSYCHLCLGAANQYIDSLLSQDEGQMYYPFNEWDIALFSSAYGSPPNPENWSSQSFWGFSSLGNNINPWLHFITPTKAVTFMFKTVNDPLLMGDTIQCFGAGINPSLGYSSASDTLVQNNYPVIEVFSPVFFKATGNIAGIVTEQTFLPITDVFVTAVNSSTYDSTNIMGEYSLNDLLIGTYDVSFSHPIYRDTTVVGVEVMLRQTTLLDMVLQYPCDYVPGDISGDGIVIGGDVSYGMAYLAFGGPPPPDSCYNENAGEWLYSAADVTGDCVFINGDITYLIGYFIGQNPPPQFCPYTPPPGPNLLSKYQNKAPLIIPEAKIYGEDQK